MIARGIVRNKYAFWRIDLLYSRPGWEGSGAIEERGDQYQVIVQISTKYRGSFNTLAF
jgi:hypothetical protein